MANDFKTNDLPYRVKYSSGKDSCVKCAIEISKGSIQFAVMEQSLTDDRMEPKWYDWNCFFKNRRPISETVIDGFATLRYTHQMEIRKQLNDVGQKLSKISPEKKISATEISHVGMSNTMQPHNSLLGVSISESPPIKKSCAAPRTEDDLALEKLIQIQNKEFFELRGKLKLNSNKEDRVAILKANNQFIPESNSEILNHVTDVLYYGAMLPCSACKDGQFIFKNLRYSCNGNISEWSKCNNIVDKPQRALPEIPSKYQIFLRGPFKIRTRILKSVPTLSDHDFELHAKQPLFGMDFFIIGETKKPREEIEKRIRLMGGNLANEITENIAAIISSSDEIQRMDKEMEIARVHAIQVVPEDFIEDVIGNDAISLITRSDLSDWGRDPSKPLARKIAIDDGAIASTSSTTDSIPKTLSLRWKNGYLVDPDSKLENVAHVYRINDLSYCAILDFVDITTNKNSYFKMQLLESDTRPEYWLFESKGRIATTIGSVSVKPFKSLNDAVAMFKAVYLDKTGNEFGDVVNFVKKPGKFHQMSESVVEPEFDPSTFNQSIPSILDEPIFKLMEMLFDMKHMKSMMEFEFDLDVEKMPLGKLKESEVLHARGILDKLSADLKCKLPSGKIIDASNQFYSFIPHNFGIRRPPVLKTLEMIQQKYDMLDALMQMKITCSFFTIYENEKQNAFDAFYETLNRSVNITVLASTSEEHKEISDYVRNAQLYRAYRLEEIFMVSRHEEIQRYRPFEGTENRRLLWHGTLLTNMVGILTNGLKISHSRHGAFGNGLYFADTIDKSALYTRPRDSVNRNSTMMLFLCEVALGQSEARNNYSSVPLNNGFHSIHGVGSYYPHTIHIRPDGLQVPNGQMHQRNEQLQLLYNEFIIYDEARVKIRYLVKLKAHF